MAAQEIMGSRSETTDGLRSYGTMLYVTTDGLHGLTVGTSFFTPKGGSVESGLTGRRLVRVNKAQQQPFPGLVYHVAEYASPIAYA